MAHGVESRLPFLDADVANLALRVPGSAKITGGETKHVLRLVAARVTPELILRRRRKLGFVAPQDQWLAGALGDLVRDALAAARKDWSSVIEPSALAGLEEKIGREANAGARAFRVLSFVRWAARIARAHALGFHATVSNTPCSSR
jgi:asparagine synthase (glutamine-hydrolysing)